MTLSNKLKKKICIVSTSRAELGIIRNLVIRLQKVKKFNTDLILTDPHLIYNKNKKNKNEVDEYKIKNFQFLKISSLTKNPLEISDRSSDLLNKISRVFSKKKYNLLIILGDRYETLIISYCAAIYRIPIFHLIGGDETLGSYDNLFRHAISKFANFHFVTNYLSKNKLLKMDIDKKKIFNYGSLAAENIKFHKFISKKEIEKDLKISLRKKNFIVTFHPETNLGNNLNKIKILLDSLANFENYLFIFTGSNNDEDGKIINNTIQNFPKRPRNIIFIKSLGQKNYFNLLKHVDGVIGNSSSAIYEAPSFKVGIINIGTRQKGRLKASNIIDVGFSKKEIILAVKKIITNKFILSKCLSKNPYEITGTHSRLTKKITKFLN